MSNWSLSNIFKGDKVIWMVFFFLCMISIIEVYSASSSLSYKGGNYWSPILKHGGTLFLGAFMMIVVMNIKCRYFKLATPSCLCSRSSHSFGCGLRERPPTVPTVG